MTDTQDPLIDFARDGRLISAGPDRIEIAGAWELFETANGPTLGLEVLTFFGSGYDFETFAADTEITYRIDLQWWIGPFEHETFVQTAAQASEVRTLASLRMDADDAKITDAVAAVGFEDLPDLAPLFPALGILAAIKHGFDGASGAAWGRANAPEDNTIGALLEFGNRSNTVEGTTRDDLIYTHGGHDTVFAGDGHDKVVLGFGDDRVWGGTGHDELHGGHGDDLLVGGAGNDFLWGQDGDDVIRAGSGNDVIDANRGFTHDGDKSWVDAGAGDDFIFLTGAVRARGGEGADTFLSTFWGAGRGRVENDVIQDFDVTEDKIGMFLVSGNGWAGLAGSLMAEEMLLLAQQRGDDVVFKYSRMYTLRLEDVDLADLTEDNFESDWKQWAPRPFYDSFFEA